MEKLPGIEFVEIANGRPAIDSDASMYQIPFYKDEEYFSSYDSMHKFLKGVESLVRKHDRYSKYKKYLMEEVKLNHCQVLKDVDKDDAPIEMHHGPIFTLYDYAKILTLYFLQKGWKITTYRVADQLLKEHEDNKIQIVMLSETIHDEVHDRNIFIPPSMAFGDLHAFVDKYGECIRGELRDKYNRYLDKASFTSANDYETLELNSALWESADLPEI